MEPTNYKGGAREMTSYNAPVTGPYEPFRDLPTKSRFGPREDDGEGLVYSGAPMGNHSRSISRGSEGSDSIPYSRERQPTLPRLDIDGPGRAY